MAQLMKEQVSSQIEFISHAAKAYRELFNGDMELVERQINVTRDALELADKLFDQYAASHNGAVPQLGLYAIGTRRNPRRLIIAISGFLTEGKNPNEQWDHLIMHANKRNIGTYALGYSCKSKAQTKTIERAQDFADARNEAKFAGKLLACVLATRYPFLSQSVSLIGHSLGCQVIKSCLKTLNLLQANNLIQNVTLMAGAATLFDKNPHKIALWSNVFSNTVAGMVRNVHTSKDFVLLLFQTFTFQEALGRQAIFVKDKATSDAHFNAAVGLESKAVLPQRQAVFTLSNYSIHNLMSQFDREGRQKKSNIGHQDFLRNLYSIFNFI